MKKIILIAIVSFFVGNIFAMKKSTLSTDANKVYVDIAKILGRSGTSAEKIDDFFDDSFNQGIDMTQTPFQDDLKGYLLGDTSKLITWYKGQLDTHSKDIVLLNSNEKNKLNEADESYKNWKEKSVNKKRFEEIIFILKKLFSHSDIRRWIKDTLKVEKIELDDKQTDPISKMMCFLWNIKISKESRQGYVLHDDIIKYFCKQLNELLAAPYSEKKMITLKNIKRHRKDIAVGTLALVVTGICLYSLYIDCFSDAHTWLQPDQCSANATESTMSVVGALVLPYIILKVIVKMLF